MREPIFFRGLLLEAKVSVPAYREFAGGSTTPPWERLLTINGSGYEHEQWLNWDRGLWPDNTTFAIVADKELHTKVTGEEVSFLASENIRRDALCGAVYNENIIADMIALCVSPLDIVHLTADAIPDVSEYEISRKPAGGDYAVIASVDAIDYRDGPLLRGDYIYKATAIDEYGHAADSNEVPITVSTVPEPVEGLAYTYSDTARICTVAWTHPDATNVDHYAIYLSGSDGILEFDGDITDTASELSWEHTFSAGTTGTFAIMVRAVGANGKMERGIFNTVYFRLV